MLVLVVVVLLILVLYYNSTSNNNLKYDNVLLFYREDCSFCEIFKPEWVKIEKALGSRAKKYNIANKELSSLVEKYGITGVPTIILLSNDKYKTYDGDRKADNIISLLV